MRKIITLLFCNLLLGEPYHCGIAMKKLNLLLSLTLLFGAKAFAQDGKENKAPDLPRAPWQWAYTYEYDNMIDSVVARYSGVYELHDGRILATGSSFKRNNCGVLVGSYTEPDAIILALDADGTELGQATYHKDGYGSYNPYVLENNEGETFILMSYNPDHDTCSSNYFKNFYPPIDHSILALYKLNEDLSVAESHEWNIPIDTLEFDTIPSIIMRYGQICIFSAMVDSDGCIVGGYAKTVSSVPDPQTKDSTVFFKMDFKGNMVKRAGYETTHSGCQPSSYYRYFHMVEADSVYVYYGWDGYVVDQSERNIVYLDKDFNVVGTGRYLQSPHLPGIQGNRWFFYDQNVLRSPNGTTYMTCLANETERDSEYTNYYCCILYEFDDSHWGGTVPIKHYIERKTKHWDWVPRHKGVDVASDNTLYFAYSLNIGLYEERDSWIQIEHLTPEFEVLSTVYYDLPGEQMHSYANSITATQDGGVLLALRGWNLDTPDYRYESVVKFPAEVFLGVDEAHASGLKLAIAYPNPGGSEMHIRTAVENAAVEVYDMNGRLVAQQPVLETETVLDATDWAAGTYVWKVISAGKDVESGKWVKE